MYITKLIKIKTEFIDKDPLVVVLEGAEEKNIDDYCFFNRCKLINLIPLPGTLNKNTLLQVALFEKDMKSIWI